MNKIEEIMRGMTLDEKIGQLFIVRCPRENDVADVAEYHLGGYTLYAVDYEGKTPDEVRRTMAEYQNNSKIPMFIAVDEEGGGVVRASKYPEFRNEPFASPQNVYRTSGMDGLIADTAEKCEFLRGLGMNLNYAPVCDLTFDPKNYIHHRTMGLDAKASGECIAAIVREMGRHKFGCSLKHFPGYGDNVDTHTGMARDSVRTVGDFKSRDYLPFAAGIEAGAGMVMVAHIIVGCFDEKLPASLSPKVHEILRNELGFDGVIVTDSLDMGAITDFTGGSEAAVAALLAGNDLLCCSSYKNQIPALRKAVADGTVTEARIDESVARILKLKLELGIIA